MLTLCIKKRKKKRYVNASLRAQYLVLYLMIHLQVILIVLNANEVKAPWSVENLSISAKSLLNEKRCQPNLAKKELPIGRSVMCSKKDCLNLLNDQVNSHFSKLNKRRKDSLMEGLKHPVQIRKCDFFSHHRLPLYLFFCFVPTHYLHKSHNAFRLEGCSIFPMVKATKNGMGS